MADKDHIQSIEKCFTLLSCISTETPFLSLDELTRKSGYSKTTCFRFLKTMRDLGLVDQDPNNKAYQLGPRLISLGLTALKGMNLRRAALPVMLRLRKETQETVNLAILSDTEVIFIERIMSDYLVNTNINIGDRLPVYCASLGKAILAFLDAGHQEEIITRLNFKAKTERTIVTQSSLRKELSEIKSRGYALNDEELEKGLRAVAAPVINYTGEAFAGINIAWSSARRSGRRVFGEFSEKVIVAAKEISFKMGHSVKI